jgi:membrane fusion protein (multidrug efflux system)
MTQTTGNNDKTPEGRDSAPGIRTSNNSHRPSHRKLIWIIAAGVLVATVVFGLPYYRYYMSHESTDDAFIDGHIVAVSPRVSGHVARVYVTDNMQVKAGDLLVELDPADYQVRLDAAQAALEAALAADRSRNFNVDLTRITATAGLSEAQADVKAAQASVETAKAQAAAAARQRDQADAQLDLSIAALDQAKAEADSVVARHQRDSMDLKRYQEMARTQTVTEQDLDHAVAAERMSKADLIAAQKKIQTQQAIVRQAMAAQKAAEDNLRKANSQVVTYRAQLDQSGARLTDAQSAPKKVEQSRSLADVSRADIAKARAGAEQARLNLSYTKIFAPTDGHVTKKAVEPGVFVQVGQPLMAIVQPDVWVTANFKETQLTRMRPGQQVEIKVDAYPDITLHGHVDSIQHGTGSRFSLLPPENATGNYVKVVQRVPVKIVFNSNAEVQKVLLAPGMSVIPEVNVASAGSESDTKKIELSQETFIPREKGADSSP